MSQKNCLKKQIAAYQRRLQLLKERQATQGIVTDPSVLTEIEDIETLLEELQVELEPFGSAGKLNVENEAVLKQAQVKTEDENGATTSRVEGTEDKIAVTNNTSAYYDYPPKKGVYIWLGNNKGCAVILHALLLKTIAKILYSTIYDVDFFPIMLLPKKSVQLGFFGLTFVSDVATKILAWFTRKNED